MNMFVQSLIVLKEGSWFSSYPLFLTFLLPIRPPSSPSDYLSSVHLCPPSHHSFPLTSSIFYSQSIHLSFFPAFCLSSVCPSFLHSFYSSIYDPSIIHQFIFTTCLPSTVFLSLFASLLPSFLPLPHLYLIFTFLPSIIPQSPFSIHLSIHRTFSPLIHSSLHLSASFSTSVHQSCLPPFHPCDVIG